MQHTFPNSDLCMCTLNCVGRLCGGACSLFLSLTPFSPVLYQWSMLWTWSLWSTPWEDGRRTRSSSPAPTASACHLRLMRRTWRRRASISSLWRVFSSTITSRSPQGFFCFCFFLLVTISEIRAGLICASVSPLQTADWHLRQVPLHLHSLWGMQTKEKVTSCQGNFGKVHWCAIAGWTLTRLLVCLQHEDVHGSWPPGPVWRPRLAHVLETQERDGEQLRQHR